MNILSDFFSSDTWSDISARVIATFSLSGVATVTNAAAQPLSSDLIVKSTTITDLIQIFTLISYGVSILVGATVLCRFVLWLKDRNKHK